MQDQSTSEIAARLQLRETHVENVLRLTREHCCVEFIATYRKSATGGLDESAIRAVLEHRNDLAKLASCKEAALQDIRGRGTLTPEMERAILRAPDPRRLHDLIVAFNPRRDTAAATAVARGLAPLAKAIRTGNTAAGLDELGANYVHHDREVHTADDALAGASHIIAEQLGTMPRVRRKARDAAWSTGVLRCSPGAAPEEQVKEFRDYFSYSEPVRDVPPHRVLAINRGERKKGLKVVLDMPLDQLLSRCREFAAREEHPFADFLTGCLRDALQRLVLPSIVREVRCDLTQRAERHAIEVFGTNVCGMLMTPPVRGVRVLGIDPGFRTGCKTTVVDADGALQAETILYAHEPHRRWDEAKKTLLEAIRKHKVDVVAIGNGTGCHETEQLVAEVIAEYDLPTRYTLVTEAGAGAYAAGELAAEEFPDLEPALRATVSVARRLQDPLSEFTKVDPRVVGVGLYQYDVDPERLKEHLDAVVRMCVNRVGVDVNKAHVALLRNVAGLNAARAREILAHRRRNGPFRSREQLKEVPGLDSHAFRNCAGFLRIYDGENPLDRTGIHPESYAHAERLIEFFGGSPGDLTTARGVPGLRSQLEMVTLEDLANQTGIDVSTLSGILHCLEHPGYDPRERNAPPIFKRQMTRLEDLKPGTWLKGTVRNVVDFGAFVDVGLKEDGLVHVSQFSNKYVKNPTDFLHVGQTVDVRVISTDPARRRIALSMIRDPKPPPSQEESGA